MVANEYLFHVTLDEDDFVQVTICKESFWNEHHTLPDSGLAGVVELMKAFGLFPVMDSIFEAEDERLTVPSVCSRLKKAGFKQREDFDAFAARTTP